MYGKQSILPKIEIYSDSTDSFGCISSFSMGNGTVDSLNKPHYPRDSYQTDSSTIELPVFL